MSTLSSVSKNPMLSEQLHPFISRFWKINRRYVLFHLFFSFLLFFELLCFSLFFAKLAQTTLIAFYLAGIFLTIFVYLLLMFYFQARRPEKLFALRNELIETCKKAHYYVHDSRQMKCAIAEVLLSYLNSLTIQPVRFPWAKFSKTLAELIEKFRIWSQWKDLLKMKELLISTSILHYVDLIKANPSDLEMHASLASTYLLLSKIYRDPSKLAPIKILDWMPAEYASETMRQKFEKALLCALEEYQIIDGFAPHNPWVYAARASIYHELNWVEKEITEFETIHKLDPQNSEVLLRLGILYFNQGQNALGLKTYETLQKIDMEKASQLIVHYNAYALDEFEN